MAKPTNEEVQAEIQKLRTMKPKVRRHSLFGDDNWSSIDAQLWVLEKQYGTNDIYDRYDDEGDDINNVLDNALSARAWLDGEEDESPSDSWAALVDND